MAPDRLPSIQDGPKSTRGYLTTDRPLRRSSTSPAPTAASASDPGSGAAWLICVANPPSCSAGLSDPPGPVKLAVATPMPPPDRNGSSGSVGPQGRRSEEHTSELQSL